MGRERDYQEINSQTGLALLTSQGSAVAPWDHAANTGQYYCGFSVKETPTEEKRGFWWQ